jgi:uncharacterized protein YjbI with pentapeptide repeats
MTGLIFEACNLDKAIFDNTKIDKADYRSAINYSIDPEKNSIKQAKFSKNGLEGLLLKYNLLID